MKGIINLNKIPSISSAAAVSKVRRILGEKAVGHMGTLDPMASGVLPIGVGKATRLFDYFLKKEKTYTATFEFGVATDTLDSTGTTIGTSNIIPTESEISSVIQSMTGKQLQIPPIYSAKNIGGRRAYQLARQGQEVELKPSEIEIFDIKLSKSAQKNSFVFDIHCSSGTYIRSIARDIAAKCGTLAIMTQLVRTRAGRFTLEDSVTLEQLENDKQGCIIPVETVLEDMPRLILADEYFAPLTNGIKIKNTFTTDETFLLVCKGELFGIAETSEEGNLKIKTYLRD